MGGRGESPVRGRPSKNPKKTGPHARRALLVQPTAPPLPPLHLAPRTRLRRRSVPAPRSLPRARRAWLPRHHPRRQAPVVRAEATCGGTPWALGRSQLQQLARVRDSENATSPNTLLVDAAPPLHPLHWQFQSSRWGRDARDPTPAPRGRCSAAGVKVEKPALCTKKTNGQVLSFAVWFFSFLPKP